MRQIHHMSMNIQGCLNNHKRKKITFMQDDDGNFVSDTEAREYLASLQAKGHKLMSCSNECEGFDPFEHGCPGHPIEDDEKATHNDQIKPNNHEENNDPIGTGGVQATIEYDV